MNKALPEVLILTFHSSIASNPGEPILPSKGKLSRNGWLGLAEIDCAIHKSCRF